MAAISKINYGPGKERFYGFVFGKKANQAMTSDQEILASLAHLNPFEALGKLHYKGLIVTEVAAVIALSACNAVIKGQDRLIETPAVAEPRIAYFTQDTIQGDPTLQSQLAGVQNLSGKGNDCTPAIVMVEGGNAGGETAGFCTRDNVITNVVVRGDRNGTQQTVNEDLITRAHTGSDGKTDMVFIEYGSGNKRDTLFTYDPATKITTWHFTSGGVVEFPAAKGPFEELVGKILEPGGVAVAAGIDTPTPTATLSPSPTKAPPETPTLVPTPEVSVQTWAPKTFQDYEAMLRDQGIKLVDFGGSSSHRYDLPNVSSYSLPGFDLDIGIASGVTLVDYQPDFGSNGQKNLIFGFSRGGVNHFFLVRTATCKLVDTWMSPSIATLKQGTSYSLDIISGFVSDLGALVNGSNCGVEYSDLIKTKPTELNRYFSGTVNSGEIDDLSSKFLVYRIRK